jgi:hypothetical protein
MVLKWASIPLTRQTGSMRSTLPRSPFFDRNADLCRIRIQLPLAMDTDKTLEELEGEAWGRPAFASYVVTTCHAMRRKRLVDLTDEELRLAIGQQMSMRFLVPLAINRLEMNPVASGDMYYGALLEHVLKVVAASEVTEEQLRSLDAVVQHFTEAAPRLESSWREECLPAIMEAIGNYRAYRAQ